MDLNKLRRDIEEGIKQGIVYVEKGVALVKEKAGELTDEGKKQYRMFELKTRLQKDIAALGAKVYALTAAGSVKPVHQDVQKLIDRIGKAEKALARLEGKAAVGSAKSAGSASPKKALAKKAVSKKPAVKKSVMPKHVVKKKATPKSQPAVS